MENSVENSGETITLTTDISQQISEQEKNRNIWLSEKADFLLASDNKKELIIDLITDFNKILGATKQIDKICREGVKRYTSSGLRSSLVEVIRLFDPDFEPESSK